MVTTNTSISLTAGAAGTPPATPARAISAVVTGATSQSTQPGAAAIGDFASLLDHLGGSATAGSGLAPDSTPSPAQTAVPALQNPSAQVAIPGQPTSNLLAPDQPTLTARPLPATLAGQVKFGANTKGDAPKATAPDDSANENEPVISTLAAPIIPVPTPIVLAAPAPIVPPPVVTPAQAGDAKLSSVDATASVASAAPHLASLVVPTTDRGETPTTALVAAQAAATPQVAQAAGRASTDRATGSIPVAGAKEMTADADQPSTENTVVPMVTPALAAIMTTNQNVMPPAPTLASTVFAASPPSIQPGSSSAPSTRTARSAAEPAAASAPVSASLATPVPEPSASSTQPVAITAAAPILGTVATPAVTTSVTKPLQPNSGPPSPASQVAQAIIEPVKVLMSSGVHATATASHVTTIQITPVELGRVDIRIERTADGPAKIQLVAERPETLSRLVHDQSQLQQALDQAGVPQSGRTLDFSLAPAPALDPGATPSLAGGNASGGSSTENEHQRQSGTYANRALGTANEATSTPINQFRSIRAGIDITA